MGGHGQGLIMGSMRVTGQLLLQLVADRSVTHNLAYTVYIFSEKSLQNMQTGLQNSRPVCGYKCCFGCVEHYL
jgi:hypothetical protein